MGTGLRHGWVLVFAISTTVLGAEPAPTYQSLVADAERLERHERWSASGDAYLQALRLRPDARDAESIAIKAIQMHSSFNDLGCFWKKDGKVGSDPIPIEGELAKLFGAYDVYLTLFPSSKMAGTFRYQKAHHLEDCNYFGEAADLYKQIYERENDRKLAGYSRAGYRRVRGGATPGPDPGRGQNKGGVQ